MNLPSEELLVFPLLQTVFIKAQQNQIKCIKYVGLQLTSSIVDNQNIVIGIYTLSRWQLPSINRFWWTISDLTCQNKGTFVDPLTVRTYFNANLFDLDISTKLSAFSCAFHEIFFKLNKEYKTLIWQIVWDPLGLEYNNQKKSLTRLLFKKKENTLISLEPWF